MSAAPKVAPAPAPAPTPLRAPPGSAAPSRTGRLARRLAGWPARVAWSVGRTGRPGLVGLALLLAAALFLVSTHLEVQAEIEALRGDLAAAQRPARPSVTRAPEPALTQRDWPARADAPALLGRLFGEARRARLAVDTARYESRNTRGGGVVRHQVDFPVSGPYPQIRAFLGQALASIPELAVDELLLQRKSIGDGDVEAQVRMSLYTADGGLAGFPGGVVAAAASGRTGAAEAATPGRVVPPAHAEALFARHSWYVAPPPKKAAPPPPEPPPPEPTAPAFPFTFVGSLAPAGRPSVYFLARGDRVIDAHVGDKLDGVYQLESAEGGQLVFVYLPLQVRHTLSTGVSR